MRLFNTVQELWSYCAFCPLCQEICREPLVDVAIDSDGNIHTTYEKKDQFLYITCEKRLWKRSKTYQTVCKYVIDCVNNTFTVQSLPDTPQEASCYIQSLCDQCRCSFVYGSDMELRMPSQTVSNIGLDREHFELTDDKDRYNINYYYGYNNPPGQVMYIEREPIDCEYDKDADRELGIRLPIMELDFSDQKKIINKLKTLILFS